MIAIKNLIIIILILLAIYWLVDHTSPLPYNHEQFGLYDHTMHRIIGVVCLIAAGLVAWKWKKSKYDKKF